MKNWSRTKLVSAVVLGVSLVSLVAALISGFTDSLSILIDSGRVLYYNPSNVGGWLLLADVCLGAAFLVTLLLAIKMRSKACANAAMILAIWMVLFLIASATAWRATLSTYTSSLPGSSDNGKVYADSYTEFVSYVAQVIAITVYTVLALFSYNLLNKESAKADTTKKIADTSTEKTSD